MRVQKASNNAMVIAKYFDSNSKIAKTIYPGLESHPQNNISKKQQITPHGDIIFGSMVSIVFHSKGEMEDFIKKINLFSLAESLGGVESLIEHPGIMTHASIDKKIRQELGISDCLLRLSVGIEDVDDLIESLRYALDKV